MIYMKQPEGFIEMQLNKLLGTLSRFPGFWFPGFPKPKNIKKPVETGNLIDRLLMWLLHNVPDSKICKGDPACCSVTRGWGWGGLARRARKKKFYHDIFFNLGYMTLLLPWHLALALSSILRNEEDFSRFHLILWGHAPEQAKPMAPSFISNASILR